MFNKDSRHLLDLSVQNVPDFISENFNHKYFPKGACARNSLEKCAVRNPDGRYHAHIATILEIRVSQNLAKLGGEPIRGGRTGEK